MAEYTPEQLQQLAQMGGQFSQMTGGPVGFEPAGALIDPILDYHTPVYRVPTEADQAQALELQKLRAELANQRAERVNQASEIRIGGMTDAMDALASLGDAHAKESQASAQVRAEQVRATAALRQNYDALAAATRYQQVENTAATTNAATEMQNAVTGAVTESQKNPDPKAWESNLDRVATALASQSNAAVQGQKSDWGQAGAWRASGMDAQAALTAYVGAAPGTPEQKQAMMQRGMEIIGKETAAYRPSEDMLQSLNEQAAADERKGQAYIREIGRSYGLPDYIVEPFVQQQATLARWNDPADANAMNQMAMAASDWAVAPMDKALAELDVQIGQLTTASGDPFYESLSAFAEDHPWYETWRRASGFRNHEEAMRWITNHADPDNGNIVGRLDTLYAEQPPENWTVEGMRERLVQERQAQQAKVKAEPEETGARPAKITGYQTNGLARAGDEIAGMFRRDPGPQGIPSGGEYSMQDAASQLRGGRPAYPPTMEQKGVPTYKPGEPGPSSPRGYPMEPVYGRGAAGAGAGGAAGPQSGQGQPGTPVDGAVRPTAALTIGERLRRAGRPFGLGAG